MHSFNSSRSTHLTEFNYFRVFICFGLHILENICQVVRLTRSDLSTVHSYHFVINRTAKVSKVLTWLYKDHLAGSSTT